MDKVYVYKISLSQANMVYKSYHRHLNETQGHKMSFIMTGTKDYFKVDSTEDLDLYIERLCLNPFADENKNLNNIGVLSIGRPVGRFKDKTISEITRICFNPDFKPRGKPNSFERTLPSKFVKKSLEIYKHYYPKVTKVITYISKDESGAFLRHAGFTVDKIVKASDGWVKRREKELDSLENITNYELEMFEERIDTHKKMVKSKLRFTINI